MPIGTPSSTAAAAITSDHLLHYSQCHLKAHHTLHGTEARTLSALTTVATRSGDEFEKTLVMDPGLWLFRLKALAPRCDLSTLGIQANSGTTTEAKILWTQKHIASVRRGVPALLHQAAFGTPEDSGRADLAFWTGDEWILGDIKRSEAVQSEHGLQLYFYHDLFKRLFPGIELSDTGFILTCAPGYLYTQHMPPFKKAAVMANVVLTSIDLRFLRGAYMEAHRAVLDLRRAEAPPPHEPRLQPACVECPYQLVCYGTLRKRGDHLSVGVREEADFTYLEQLGITSMSQLQADLERDRPELLTLTQGRKLIKESLLRRLKLAGLLGGFSTWRGDPSWNSVWVCAGVNIRGSFLRWLDSREPTKPLVAPSPTATRPKVIVCENKGLVDRAKSELARAGMAADAFTWIALQEEVQAHVHFPLPSYDIYTLAPFLQQVAGRVNAMTIDTLALSAASRRPRTAPSEPDPRDDYRVCLFLDLFRALQLLEGLYAD